MNHVDKRLQFTIGCPNLDKDVMDRPNDGHREQEIDRHARQDANQPCYLARLVVREHSNNDDGEPGK